MRIQLEAKLELGDIGVHPAQVAGSVNPVADFSNPHGVPYYETQIHSVIALIGHTLIDVTDLISKAARIDLEEELEAEFEVIKRDERERT